MLVWPKRDDVLTALRDWTDELKRSNANVVRVGCFGSLANGTYGFGSDADVVVVVSGTDRPMWERPIDFDVHGIPVDVDLLVYTADEWTALLARGDRFSREMNNVLWL